MLKEDKIIALYWIVDDLLKGIDHQEPLNRKVFDREVITTALVAALYFGGHLENATGFMKRTGLVPRMLDNSRFSRRLHGLTELLCTLFFQVGQHLKDMAGASHYVVDCFAVAVCANIRISRSKLLKAEQWSGKQLSMRRYFYGVKLPVLTTASGIVVEFCFVPGSESHLQALKKLPLSVAEESSIYADSAYTDYTTIEDDMKEADFIKLRVQRKSNSKRKDEPWIRFLKEHMRKGIETTFSMLKALFLRKIHAVTFQGFLLKIMLFIVAYTFDKLV